jgi:predicted dehydrogenase
LADVRVAVVGVAGIGQAHLFAIPSVAGATLAGVYDVNAEAAAKAAADHQTVAFGTYDALCTGGDVDAVSIATPPATHEPLVREALEAGLHVYCEKPFTPTAEAGHALADLAEQRGVVVQVGLQFRYHHGYATTRRIVTEELGEVSRASLVATNWFRAQRYFDVSPWRSTFRGAGGGVAMSQAVHQLDALLTMVGMPSRVEAKWYRAAHDADVEDELVALLEWPNGARGTVVASLNDPAGYERIEVFGDRGAIECADYDLRRTTYASVARTIVECPDEYPSEQVTWAPVDVPRKRSEWFDMMIACQQDFADAIRDGRAPAIDAREGTRVVELANALYLSAARREPVDLPFPLGEYTKVYERLCDGSIAVPGAPRR